MDTRSKIVSAEEAATRYESYSVVLASFDVLTAARARSLREIVSQSGPLIAVLADIPGSLLPLAARAELAAALAIIDCVVTSGATDGLIANACAVFDEREADRQRTTDLIAYVRRRNVG